jgi:hypothetical protein
MSSALPVSYHSALSPDGVEPSADLFSSLPRSLRGTADQFHYLWVDHRIGSLLTISPLAHRHNPSMVLTCGYRTARFTLSKRRFDIAIRKVVSDGRRPFLFKHSREYHECLPRFLLSAIRVSIVAVLLFEHSRHHTSDSFR